MTMLQFLMIAILVLGALALTSMMAAQRQTGNPFIPAVLFVLFSGFTAVQLAQEGAMMFVTNHSHNLTGIQVWWDLITATLIALFLLLPRARAAGMNIVPWALFVGTTASIGLLAMCARLFWLEQAQGTPARA
ncbi:MAG: hypothetical protein ACKO1N_04450 [Erythrobacter sp.]